MDTARINIIIGSTGVLVVILIGIAGMYAVKEAKNNKPIPVGEDVAILSSQHIQVGQEHGAYNSNPPTSGDHYEESIPDGFYDKEMPDEALIHNLEHGYIWISYQPDKISPQDLSSLKEITKPYSKIVITPRSKNDTVLAVAGWGKLEKLEGVDKKKIISFIKLNKPGKAPEPMGR